MVKLFLDQHRQHQYNSSSSSSLNASSSPSLSLHTSTHKIKRRKHGYIKQYYRGTDIVKSEGFWDNNKRINQHIWYYKTGIVFAITNHNREGLKDGPDVMYYSDGSIRRYRTYICGKLNQVEYEYYKGGGGVKSSIRHRLGKLHGSSICYNRAGRVTSHERYFNDEKQGTQYYYNTAGTKLAWVDTMVRGQRHGACYFYDEVTGCIECIELWRYGKQHGVTRYYTNNIPTKEEIYEQDLLLHTHHLYSETDIETEQLRVSNNIHHTNNNNTNNIQEDREQDELIRILNGTIPLRLSSSTIQQIDGLRRYNGRRRFRTVI